MRIPALAILTIATVAAPAWAQTYDPSYPVCLQSYGIDGGNIECGYTSLAQCTRRHRAAPPNASSIHILRAHECLRDDNLSGIAASTNRPSG